MTRNHTPSFLWPLLQLCLREQMSLAMRIRVMTQLARALHYLHTGDPHILHRDIKPQNFVVVEAEISERTGILRNVKVRNFRDGWLAYSSIRYQK